MATIISHTRDRAAGESLSRILIVEGAAGTARRRRLEERLKSSVASGARAFSVSCDFDSGGPWAGVSELFAELLPDIQRQSPRLVERHALELVTVLPRLRRSLHVRNPSLTDLASPEEKTRNYPADRAFRIVHGLIDLLDSWKSATCADAEWVIACDAYDLAGTMSGRFFDELMRRRGERLNLRLLVGVEPGNGESARRSLGAQATAGIVSLDVEGEPPDAFDAEVAAQMASDLELRIGDDRVEKQVHSAELIALWQMAGRPDKILRCRFFCLETYNTLGLYEDALRYGRGLLSLAQDHAPEDEKLQWGIVVKLLMCHIGLLDVESSLKLAEGEGMRLAERHAAWRAHLFYLIGIFYARFQKPRDLVKGEDYLNRALEAIQEADMAEDTFHFQSVFNRNGLAMIRSFQGRFEEAIELCRAGFARLSTHLGAEKHRLHRSVLLYNIAQVYSATGSIPEAIEYYSAAIEMDPNYSEYYNERGSIFLQMGRLEEAHADYLRAIELSPPYFEVFANLGQCHRRMGNMTEAVEAYSRALDINPDHLLALLGRAKAHEELGQGEEAFADYTAALANDPTQWEAIASCGVLHYEAGDFDRSLADFDRAIELEPGQPDLYHNRATVLADLGRYGQAERDIEAALQLNPPEEDESALRALLETVRQAGASEKGLGSP
jgi:tetratricopeptide (TPR) repeat protein